MPPVSGEVERYSSALLVPAALERHDYFVSHWEVVADDEDKEIRMPKGWGWRLALFNDHLWLELYRVKERTGRGEGQINVPLLFGVRFEVSWG